MVQSTALQSRNITHSLRIVVEMCFRLSREGHRRTTSGSFMYC
jgi:hypothetical protein